MPKDSYFALGIGKTTFCTHFARAFVGRGGVNIQEFLKRNHGSTNAHLFVRIIQNVVANSLTIGIDFELVARHFTLQDNINAITTKLAKLLLAFGLQKYEGTAISYMVICSWFLWVLKLHITGLPL